MKKPKHISDKPVYQEYLDDIPTKSEDKMEHVDAMNYIEKEYPETSKEFHKIQFEQFDFFSEEMLKNCRNDVDLTQKYINFYYQE